MAFIGRGSLPQNFLDSVSPGMRLPTPEPQYWFARAALGARLQFAALNVGAPTIQQFVSMSGGGQNVPPFLDSLVRSADAYPNAVVAVDGFGKGQGDTIKMRRPIFAGGGYDEASRVVNADKTTSTTGQSIQDEEIPVTLFEFEGPYNVANSAVQPYAIRNFDAKYRANKDQLASLVTLHLTRDYIKWLDTVIRDRFRATANITYADDVTNVLSMTAGAGHQASLDMVLKARKALSDREWQPFQNGRYILIVPTAFNTQMLGDPDYKTLSAFHGPGRNELFGYIGSIQNVDIFEVTTTKTYAAGTTVPNDTNAVPANATVEEAIMFGPGAVGFGTAQEPEARFADDTDYGKMAKVLWNAVHAFQTLDSRGIQRVLFQSA